MPGQVRGPPREYGPGLLTVVDKVFSSPHERGTVGG